MATSFPSSIDSFTNPSASDALDSVSVPHADQHANINDAMVAVQTKLGVGSGTIGTWTSYSPTFTNFTLGNGTLSARYTRLNNLVVLAFDIVTGSTSSMGTNPTMSLPVTASSANFKPAAGVLRANGTYYNPFFGAGASNFEFYYYNSSGVLASITSSTPNTWAGGGSDQLSGTIVYEAA